MEKLKIPSFLFDKLYLESNGFSGCDLRCDKAEKIQSYSSFGFINHEDTLWNIAYNRLAYWSRFIVKQTFEQLKHKPTFTQHFSAYSPDLSSLNSHSALHGPQTVHYGWRWYEMGFFSYWNPSGSVSLLCFDQPSQMRLSIQSTFRSQEINKFAPYSVFPIILDELIRLYNDSVWSIRNHICHWEAVSYILAFSIWSYNSF